MIDEILFDREKRYEKILLTLKSGVKSVICAKINCPGTNKNTNESLKAFEYLLELMKKTILTGEFEILKGSDGKSIIAGMNIECIELKSKAAQIEENHPLGRIFDIDVYNTSGAPVERTDLGLAERKCIVCGENAKICVRGKAHSSEETLKAFNKIIYDFEEKHEK